MIERVPLQKLQEIASKSIDRIAPHSRDEMAIPSYLHRNLLIRWLMWQRYEQIASLSAFTDRMTALEFGCGLGVFLPELDAKCGKVYAIDIYPEYAELLAKELDLNIHFINDVSEVADGTLDIIIAADVLEHINDSVLAEYLQNFAEKLKVGGRLIVSGPTENPAYQIGRLLAGFSGKGDYHNTDINRLIGVICGHFDLSRTRYLPFRVPPFLFKVCEFVKSST